MKIHYILMASYFSL